VGGDLGSLRLVYASTETDSGRGRPKWVERGVDRRVDLLPAARTEAPLDEHQVMRARSPVL